MCFLLFGDVLKEVSCTMPRPPTPRLGKYCERAKGPLNGFFLRIVWAAARGKFFSRLGSGGVTLRPNTTKSKGRPRGRRRPPAVCPTRAASSGADSPRHATPNAGGASPRPRRPPLDPRNHRPRYCPPFRIFARIRSTAPAPCWRRSSRSCNRCSRCCTFNSCN